MGGYLSTRASTAACEFYDLIQVGIDVYMYISLIINSKSSLTHLHGFQLLVLKCFKFQNC